jgi:hypothetical protein
VELLQACYCWGCADCLSALPTTQHLTAPAPVVPRRSRNSPPRACACSWRTACRTSTGALLRASRLAPGL